MNPRETFVRHLRHCEGPDVIVVVARAGFTAFAVASSAALVDELLPHQRIDLGDHRALAHAERSRDGVRARPALALLARAGNQVGVDQKLVGFQAQREDVVVEFEVGHDDFISPFLN